MRKYIAFYCVFVISTGLLQVADIVVKSYGYGLTWLFTAILAMLFTEWVMKNEDKTPK